MKKLNGQKKESVEDISKSRINSGENGASGKAKHAIALLKTTAITLESLESIMLQASSKELADTLDSLKECEEFLIDMKNRISIFMSNIEAKISQTKKY